MTGRIGPAVSRVDGRLKVTGAAQYTADLPIENLAHAVMVTSAIPSGQVTGLDTRAALALQGVLAVLMPENMPRLRPVNAYQDGGPAGEGVLPLQDNEVRYPGQVVALVVADTLEIALEAASLVGVRYVSSGSVAATIDDPGARVSPSTSQAMRTVAAPADLGDVARGLAEADVRLEHTYRTAVQHHHPMETHTIVAQWGRERLTVYDSTQWVLGVRNAISTAFGLEQSAVRVVSHFVGGAFGCKVTTWPHAFLAVAAARAVGRPVRLALSRAQMFTSVGHRPQTLQRITLGARRDGRLTAFATDVTSGTSTVDDYAEPVTSLTRSLYRCPNVSVRHRLKQVNSGTPVPLRGVGEAPGLFALESAMDELAEALSLDPVTLRLRNDAGVEPFSGRPWSSRNLVACLTRGAERFGWAGRTPAPRSMRDGPLLVGWGVAAAAYPVLASPTAARVRLFPDGTALVQCATHEIGTGTSTAAAQVAADALGVAVHQVRIELGDTDLPFAPNIAGARTMASVGPAVQAASLAARSGLLALATGDPASPLSGVDEEVAEFQGGRVSVRGDPHRGESWGTILARRGLPFVEAYLETLPRGATRENRDAVATGRETFVGPFTPEYAMAAFGAHFVEVKVDPDLGTIRATRVVSAFAAGRVVNLKTATSQLRGGIIMGLGMALMEATRRDPRTARVVNADLAGYLLPTAADAPDVDAFFVPEDDPHVNALGAKGVGEIGSCGTAAAVANAVYHATGRRVRELPITLDRLL